MLNFLKALRRDERGVSALEYAILAALLVGLIVAGVGLIDPTALFQNAADEIGAAVTATDGG